MMQDFATHELRFKAGLSIKQLSHSEQCTHQFCLTNFSLRAKSNQTDAELLTSEVATL